MAIYVALLRAVNLVGRNKVAMADLRKLLSELGFGDPRTLLQSGNVILETKATDASRLEARLERAIRENLGLQTEIFVRGTSEWKKLIEANPFLDEAERDPGHLLATFLADAPGKGKVEALRGAIRGREVVELEGRHAYIYYPDGVGRSKLTSSVIEKHLETRSTARNWNTVLKLQRAAFPGPGD